jgi:trans-2-enoyl-CoA reductase
MNLFLTVVFERGGRMNRHETMMDQIRRLNREEALKHERRKHESINKIKQMRLRQKEQENDRTTIPQ